MYVKHKGASLLGNQTLLRPPFTKRTRFLIAFSMVDTMTTNIIPINHSLSSSQGPANHQSVPVCLSQFSVLRDIWAQSPLGPPPLKINPNSKWPLPTRACIHIFASRMMCRVALSILMVGLGASTLVLSAHGKVSGPCYIFISVSSNPDLTLTAEKKTTQIITQGEVLEEAGHRLDRILEEIEALSSSSQYPRVCGVSKFK